MENTTRNKVNIKDLLNFLKEYKKRILEENDPIIKNIDFRVEEYITTQDKSKIYNYKHILSEKQIEILEDINIEEFVLINSEEQEINCDAFNLSNTNIFNIEKNKDLISISTFSEKIIDNYDEWYLVKINPYFLNINIRKVIAKLQREEEFSVIDKYILGLSKITESEKNDFDLELYNESAKNLNEVQKKALLKIIESKNLALIKGPPGTGKTTLIEHFMMYSLKTEPQRRIIFATNLHTSMDSIIEKINNNSFLRLKKTLRVTKKPHSRRTAKQERLNLTKCADIYITTLASQRMNVILTEKRSWFNGLKPILIIDEASAVNIMGILMHTNNIEKIIVIGDDQQLTPIYNQNDYRYFMSENMLNEFNYLFVIPFFNFLLKNNGDICILLNINYRSKPQIVKFINNFYQGKLLLNDKSPHSSFNISRNKNYEESKTNFQFIMNQKKLTTRNTIFMCEYKKVIKDLDIFLKKKIFKTTRSIQGNEAENICLFLARNIGSNDCRSQLDFRSINVAISRAKTNVYIFSYDKIIDLHLIDKVNNWNKIKLNNKNVSISSLIAKSV